MGVCGSCGMMVNGDPKLTCAVFLKDYYPRPIKVEPLVNFPVERDLVVSLDGFMDKLEAVKPYIIRDDVNDTTGGEYRQSPAELARYKQYSMCINCMLCYSACPVAGHEDEFLGPAALALGHRYNKDSRDQGQAERSTSCWRVRRSGGAPSWASARWCAPSTWTPRGRSSRRRRSRRRSTSSGS